MSCCISVRYRIFLLKIVTQNEQKYEALKEEMMKRHNPLFENQLYAKVLKPKETDLSILNKPPIR